MESGAQGAAEIRRRALAGVAALGARGVLVRMLGLAGNVALARLLVPSEFGTVALGLALLTFAAFVYDGGIGASLVRRPEPPEPADLRAVLALQVAGAWVIAALALAIGLPVGGAGPVVAVMMLALPVMALRGPAVVVLERRLDFRPLAVVEVAEVAAYYVWGVAAVAAGLGVWGLASASLVKAVVGTVALLRTAPEGRVRPALSADRLRALLHFGARFQGVQVVGAVREQGVSVGTAVIAGTATLGLWTLALRVLQIPLLLFETLWRVSFPAMTQLLASGEEPRPLMERGVRLAAVATGFVLCAVVGSAPGLVPGVFGERWDEAAWALPGACLGLQVNGPISAAAAGFFFASGRAGTVLRGAVAQLVSFWLVGFALLGPLGTGALGLGYLAASVAETVIFSRAAHRATGARLVRELLVPLVAAVAASGLGWVLASRVEPELVGAAAGGLAAVAAYALLLAVVRRSALSELRHVVRRREVV